MSDQGRLKTYTVHKGCFMRAEHPKDDPKEWQCGWCGVYPCEVIQSTAYRYHYQADGFGVVWNGADLGIRHEGGASRLAQCLNEHTTP